MMMAAATTTQIDAALYCRRKLKWHCEKKESTTINEKSKLENRAEPNKQSNLMQTNYD